MVVLVLGCGRSEGNPTQFRLQVIHPQPSYGRFADAVVGVNQGPGTWCSAVAVGDRVLLTAAHCVPWNTVTVQAVGSGECTCHSEKAGGCEAFALEGAVPPGVDLAVCELDDSFRFRRGVETLSTDVSLLQPNAEVVLAGFGCEKWTGCPSNDQSYGDDATAGPARILGTPSSAHEYFYTVADFSKKESALCSGDSGGPVFRETTAGRRVVGIGHTGCVDDDPGRSAVVNLAAASTQKWLCDWASRSPARREIQGLTCP